MQSTLAVGSDTSNYQLQQKWDETDSVGINQNFYQQLHDKNYGIGYYHPNWQVLRLEPNGIIPETS